MWELVIEFGGWKTNSEDFAEHSDSFGRDFSGMHGRPMADSVLYAFRHRLVYRHDSKSAGKVFGAETEAGAQAQLGIDRGSGPGGGHRGLISADHAADDGNHRGRP